VINRRTKLLAKLAQVENIRISHRIKQHARHANLVQKEAFDQVVLLKHLEHVCHAQLESTKMSTRKAFAKVALLALLVHSGAPAKRLVVDLV
jgi:hypothetical protein